MRFRSGFILGAMIGYVLGARAGRHRYEQIKRWAGKMRRHPAVEQVFSQMEGVTDLGRTLLATTLDASSRELRKLS
jgi:membrane protein DedA with SNARE-associated domain